MVLGLADKSQDACLGVFNFLNWPLAVKVILGVIIMDCAVYFQHILFHFVPKLWRLHKVHHTDIDSDLTTGIRFHPIEILISLGVKMAVVVIFGIPVVAVFIFELILNSSAMFTHSNCRLPIAVDPWIRWLVVTPDMHRIHHSVYPKETNSNFGFFISFWDRFFGTYQAQPRDGHVKMNIGLSQYRNPKQITFFKLLLLPFIKSP